MLNILIYVKYYVATLKYDGISSLIYGCGDLIPRFTQKKKIEKINEILVYSVSIRYYHHDHLYLDI